MNGTENFSPGDIEDVLTYEESYPILKQYLAVIAARDEPTPAFKRPHLPAMERGNGAE